MVPRSISPQVCVIAEQSAWRPPCSTPLMRLIVCLTLLSTLVAGCAGALQQDPTDSESDSELSRSCGNGACNGNESCTSCPADCGRCVVAGTDGGQSMVDASSPSTDGAVPGPLPPPPSDSTGQQAASADSFVETIGVQTHLGYAGSVYESQY